MWAGATFVIISTFVSTFTPPAIGGFIAGRAITGFGQGLMMPAGPVYINELAPAKLRGTVMSFWQLFFALGSFLAYWINYACSKNAERLGEWDWKIVMLFQIFCPIVIISGLFFCPETPRWYAFRHPTIRQIVCYHKHNAHQATGISRMKNSRTLTKSSWRFTMTQTLLPTNWKKYDKLLPLRRNRLAALGPDTSYCGRINL